MITIPNITDPRLSEAQPRVETADASPRVAADMELLLSQIESEHHQHLKGQDFGIILQMGKGSSRERNRQRPLVARAQKSYPLAQCPFHSSAWL